MITDTEELRSVSLLQLYNAEKAARRDECGQSSLPYLALCAIRLHYELHHDVEVIENVCIEITQQSNLRNRYTWTMQIGAGKIAMANDADKNTAVDSALTDAEYALLQHVNARRQAYPDAQYQFHFIGYERRYELIAADNVAKTTYTAWAKVTNPYAELNEDFTFDWLLEADGQVVMQLGGYESDDDAMNEALLCMINATAEKHNIKSTHILKNWTKSSWIMFPGDNEIDEER